MKIKFASDIIKITFENEEPFANRSLIMSGEVLDDGFAAIVSTIKWLPSDKENTLSDSDREIVCSLIRNYNKNSSFIIQLVK
ncbi:MAG: hypothetical protein IJ292_04575 [Clostridia bacterium]|nr:hypothetical protein [Clostridia bacterium]